MRTYKVVLFVVLFAFALLANGIAWECQSYLLVVAFGAAAGYFLWKAADTADQP